MAFDIEEYLKTMYGAAPQLSPDVGGVPPPSPAPPASGIPQAPDRDQLYAALRAKIASTAVQPTETDPGNETASDIAPKANQSPPGPSQAPPQQPPPVPEAQQVPQYQPITDQQLQEARGESDRNKLTTGVMEGLSTAFGGLNHQPHDRSYWTQAMKEAETPVNDLVQQQNFQAQRTGLAEKNQQLREKTEEDDINSKMNQDFQNSIAQSPDLAYLKGMSIGVIKKVAPGIVPVLSSRMKEETSANALELRAKIADVTQAVNEGKLSVLQATMEIKALQEQLNRDKFEWDKANPKGHEAQVNKDIAKSGVTNLETNDAIKYKNLDSFMRADPESLTGVGGIGGSLNQSTPPAIKVGVGKLADSLGIESLGSKKMEDAARNLKTVQQELIDYVHAKAGVRGVSSTRELAMISKIKGLNLGNSASSIQEEMRNIVDELDQANRGKLANLSPEEQQIAAERVRSAGGNPDLIGSIRKGVRGIDPMGQNQPTVAIPGGPKMVTLRNRKNPARTMVGPEADLKNMTADDWKKWELAK